MSSSSGRSREAQARAALRKAPGISVVDHRADEGYVTPEPKSPARTRSMSAASASDPTVPHGLAMWVVADNLRKGAALNAVQIAELLCERYLDRKGRVTAQRRTVPALS